jgi:hypothetical protein
MARVRNIFILVVLVGTLVANAQDQSGGFNIGKVLKF